MNTETCGGYNGCLYRDMCNSWGNPLRYLDSIPSGFEERFWNPVDERDKAKEIMDFENIVSPQEVQKEAYEVHSTDHGFHEDPVFVHDECTGIELPITLEEADNMIAEYKALYPNFFKQEKFLSEGDINNSVF
jgi:hypothetical protein